MAKLIKGTVREGYLCLVKNEHRRNFSPENYIQGCIEWDAYGNESHLLFTEREIRVAIEKSLKHSNLIPKGNPIFNSATRYGHISFVQNVNKKHKFEADCYNFVKMHHFDDKIGSNWMAFTECELNRIMRRTVKNSEDEIEKSFLTDMFD